MAWRNSAAPILCEDDMLIESITRRPNGTHPRIGGVTYDFVPNKAGDHVAEVANKDHIKRFLSIATFRAYAVQPESAELNLSAKLQALAATNGVRKDAPNVVDETRQKRINAFRARGA